MIHAAGPGSLEGVAEAIRRGASKDVKGLKVGG
jgi:hypothetical protein